MKTYNEFLAGVTVSMQLAVEQTRDAILKASDSLNEEMKWGSPTYSINKNICSIHVHKEHLNLQFFYGAEIDEDNVLEGTGDNMRHLKILTRTKIDTKLIKKLVKKAIEFDKHFE